MAYRKIHDDFWTDPDIEELTPEQKFFYLYLITNPNVNQIGLYEFSIKRACFETGYNTDTVSKLLEYFQYIGKIKISHNTREILVVKFYWHNKSNSPKVKTHVEQLLKDVKDTSLIQYIYGMDTASQEEKEEVQEEKEEVQEGKEGKENYSEKIVDVISDIDSISDKNTLLALHIWNDVDSLRPNNKITQNAKVQTWSEPIRLLVEQDERTHEEIWKLWQRVHRDEFWRKNILSTAKLREKFDQLAIKFQPNGKNHDQFIDKLFS